MPSGSSNAIASRKTAQLQGSAGFEGAASRTRTVKRASQGDVENNASSKRMKRGKRVMSSGAESSVESNSVNKNNSKSAIADAFGDDAQGLSNPKSKKRFVGVRQRPSGRWVAEIKDTTQKIRLWLGTFDSAEEGAKAYDSAARALRGENTRTNFVPGIASCEGTVPAATSKAARLIRLRQQTAAAATAKTSASEQLGRGPSQPLSPLLRRDMNQQQSDKSWDAHSQAAALSSPKPPARLSSCKPNAQPEASQSEQAAAVTSGLHSNAIHCSLAAAGSSPRDHSSRSSLPSAADSCNGASTSGSSNDGAAAVGAAPGHQQQQSIPPAIARANAAAAKEGTSSADDDDEVTMLNSVSTTNRASTWHDDAESPLFQGMGTAYPWRSSDLALRDNPDVTRAKESCCFADGVPDGAAVSDMIPWPDYVLMDGLDVLSCEAAITGVSYPAFEFSAEAMDRDSLADQHYLSGDSGGFLLQHCHGQSELPKTTSGVGTEHPLHPRPPEDCSASPACSDSDEAGVPWSSLDLTPHCTVA